MLTSKLGTVDAVLGSTLILGAGANLLGDGEFLLISEIVVAQDAHSSIAIRAATSDIIVTQDAKSGLFVAAASSTITMSDLVAAAEITKSAESTVSISDVAEASNIISAFSTIVLSQDQNVAGPKTGNNSHTLVIISQADVSFGILGRQASSNLDLDTTNPLGGIVDSNIRNVFAVTPDPASDPLEATPGFTDAWSILTRVADTFEETVVQVIPLTQEVPQPTGKRSVDATSIILLVDDADTQTKTRSPVNILVVNQTATVFKVHRAESIIPIVGTAINGAVSLAAENTLVLNQNSTPGPIDRFVDSVITITDLAKSNIRNLFSDTTIVVTQDNNVLRPYHLETESKISGITDDIFIPPIGPNIPGVPFGISSEATFVSNPVRNPTTLITVATTSQVTHIFVGATDLAANSSIGLTQLSNLSTPAECETVIDLLSVTTDFNLNTTDALNVIVPISLATYSIKRASVVSSSAIIMRQSVGFSLIRDTTKCDYSPFVGASDSGITAPRTTLPEAKSPPLDPSIRFRLTYPPFGAGTAIDTLDLRAPNFGNRERLSATRIQRETVGGTLTIFADPIWPKIHTLQLQFNALKTVQARGLLDFIERWIGLEVGIYDYEGRLWKGIITNPEEAVIQNGIESYSATLEIEAERVFAGIGDVLATSGVVFSQESEGILTTFPGISALALNGSADYTKVPAGAGSESIPLSAFATRNSFFRPFASSPISLNHNGAELDYEDFGTLIHNWDARDIPDVTGTSIDTWPDSAGAVDLVASGTFRPTVTDAILNGERVVQFRHSVNVQRMLSDTQLPVFNNTTKTGTIFIVMTVRQIMAGGNNLLFGTNPGSTEATVLYLGGSTSTERPVAYKSPEGVVSLETPTSVLGNNTSHLLVLRRNNNEILFRRDKVTQDGHTLSTNPTPLVEDLYVGGLGSGNSADMDIAQILMYEDILNLSDIQTIEGLLTATWGV